MIHRPVTFPQDHITQTHTGRTVFQWLFFAELKQQRKNQSYNLFFIWRDGITPKCTRSISSISLRKSDTWKSKIRRITVSKIFFIFCVPPYYLQWRKYTLKLFGRLKRRSDKICFPFSFYCGGGGRRRYAKLLKKGGKCGWEGDLI